jgi:YfiH family protein
VTAATTLAADAPRPLGSPLLAREGFRHAFFTREGGVSAPPFDSLSFAWSNGDAEASVRENLRRAARSLSVPLERLYFLSQVHGTDVVRLSGDEDRDEVVLRRGDATISTAPGVACGVRVADCVPVLVGDRRSGAVAAIHSGWQGTVLDVVRAAVVALRAAIGDDGDLVAAIGPHIERCCFEVGDDVAEKLASASPALDVVDRARGPKPHVDLRRIVRAQLRALGLSDAAIDDVAGCTKCDATRFFSYRRDRERSGRHLAAIVVR